MPSVTEHTKTLNAGEVLDCLDLSTHTCRDFKVAQKDKFEEVTEEETQDDKDVDALLESLLKRLQDGAPALRALDLSFCDLGNTDHGAQESTMEANSKKKSLYIIFQKCNEIFMFFCSKPSKSYQFRMFFQNFINNLIDFANLKILKFSLFYFLQNVFCVVKNKNYKIGMSLSRWFWLWSWQSSLKLSSREVAFLNSFFDPPNYFLRTSSSTITYPSSLENLLNHLTKHLQLSSKWHNQFDWISARQFSFHKYLPLFEFWNNFTRCYMLAP